MYLMIDNYDSFTYNLHALFASCGATMQVVKNSRYIDADEYEALIFSPGPSRPERAGFMLRYITENIGRVPMFGVCLGMQALGYSLGYRITSAPSIMHGKTDSICVSPGSILFDGVPSGFTAVRYHSLAVSADDSRVTARSHTDGAAMALEDADLCVFGVQFHPESILSEEGSRIVHNFMSFTRSRRDSNGNAHSKN